MYKTGGFWEDNSKREHCYSVRPLISEDSPRHVEDKDWQTLYQKLGELGYRFRDVGYDIEHIVLSLNKPLTQDHLTLLEDAFAFATDDGHELGCC